MQEEITSTRCAQSPGTDVTTTQELADEYGITINPDLSAELRRPAWCDTDEKWRRYRAEIEAAWPAVMDTAIARVKGGQR